MSTTVIVRISFWE